MTPLTKLRRLLAEAQTYAKARDHVTRDGSDELTAKDVADGYREGYQKLHRLVCQFAETLPDVINLIEEKERRTP